MAFLRNAWYAAGWKNAFTAPLTARTFLDEPVVIIRWKDGTITALEDRCPHRFAPLSMGRPGEDRIACGYHGLEFDRSGKCVRNPHGNHVTPPTARVRAYPMTERYGMMWIWMGAQERADPQDLPALPFLEDESFKSLFGYLHVPANYEFVTDNLLDLTHVPFLHPFLSSPRSADRTTFHATQVGDAVSAYYDLKGEPISALFKLLWEGDEQSGDLRSYMHWSAPAHMWLDTAMTCAGENSRGGVAVPTAHLLTPDSDDATHYFWAAGRNRRQLDEELDAMIREGTVNTFEHEDEPIIRAARSRMRSNDFFAHRPLLLPADEAAVRARRVLKRLIESEAGWQTQSEAVCLNAK